MPCDYRQYHPQWKEISRQIRDQADNRCEQCGVQNGQRVYREWKQDDTVIVLTVHHLCDCDKRECHDPTHLRALCQACHLAADRDLHRATRAENRSIRMAARFVGSLLPEVGR